MCRLRWDKEEKERYYISELCGPKETRWDDRPSNEKQNKNTQ
jgi:hypothetical protein